MSKFPDINLPVWMNKGEPLTLAHASKIWWERVCGWLTFPLAQIDVDTCDEQLLSLLAYQRDINRFPGESLALFRLRVKHAFVNALDAGSLAGFARIFERLEIGQVQQLERQLWLDWDVILLRINDEQLSRDNVLMMNLVRQYGRTCRRYFFDVLNGSALRIRPGRFDLDVGFHHAAFVSLGFRLEAITVNGWNTSTFAPSTAFSGATYQLVVLGAGGEITWRVTGPATITPVANGCQVKLTGMGAITVTGTDALGNVVTHRIAPTLWFAQQGGSTNFAELEGWCQFRGGRSAKLHELNAGQGAPAPRGNLGGLLNEWGDMAAFGWPGEVGGSLVSAFWLSGTVVDQQAQAVILSGQSQAGGESRPNGAVLAIPVNDARYFRYCWVVASQPPTRTTITTEKGARLVTERGASLITERETS